MAKTIVWCGALTNLGRFGFVKWGDELELSDAEYSMVTREKDTRYRDFAPGDKKPEKPKALRAIEDVAVAEGEEDKKEQDEADRLERLKKVNAEDTALVELKSKTKADLLEFAAGLQAKGYGLTVDVGMQKGNILQAIEQAMKNPPAAK